MPDWTALRRLATRHHLRLRASLADDGLPLPTAEALLAAAEVDTGFSRIALPAGDTLLAGAHAVLDRDMESVWYARGRGATEARQLFAQAHEFAHYWLHPDVTRDACVADEEPEAFLSPERAHASRIAEGYSPAERREAEANLFAAELLLPAPFARRAFVEFGWNAAQIAHHTGLSESCVLSQLMQAALLPAETTETAESSPLPTGTAPDDGLDASQRAAARIEAGPVLVDAGPGTGKTRTLIARILFLLREGAVAPESILALTFSNKAAEEMRTRLREVIGETAERVWIGTFHAFGYEILRKFGGYAMPPTLLETADAITLLESHLDRLNLREFEYLSDPTLPFPDLLSCISRAKDELKTPDDYSVAALRQAELATDEKTHQAAARSQEIAHVYAVYQELLRENNRLDFGDLLMQSVLLLDSQPELTARLQQVYPHILADEYQDINRASAQLLRRLAGEGRGFWAVGDLRQAIYRFRGASPANVREFERDFPGGRRLRLERNYRSRPPLVSLFSAAAAGMTSRKPDADDFTAWEARRADTKTEAAITVALAENENAQGDGIAAQIRKWETAGVPKREQAILCRTNAQADDLAERLEKRGITTQRLGGLFERDEVKDLLALLSLVCEAEGTALARVGRFPEYAVPEADIVCLLEEARKANQPFPGALALAETLPELSENGRRGLTRLWSHVLPLLYRGNAWLFLARYLFETSDYLRALLREETVANRLKAMAIYQLLSFAQSVNRRFEAETARSPRAAFLAHLRHLLACGEERSVRLPAVVETLDGVRLLTAHTSKGLEFPVVYVPNLIRGQFPTRASGRGPALPPTLLEDSEDVDTDRELFFVALSRARDQLILCRPVTWKGKPAQSSPLLDSIESALYDQGAEWVTWREEAATAAFTVEETALRSHPSDKPTLSLSALQQYQNCPRQYYYQRVAHLPEPGADSAYYAFNICLQETLRWLQTERAAGRAPSYEETEAQLERNWAERGPNVARSAHARLLRRHADGMLSNAYHALQDAQNVVPGLELSADLPNGRVTLYCDHAERLPDGSLRVARHLKSRAKSDDHTDPRLALMRYAARQSDASRPVQIAIDYLRDGERRDVVESERYEPARVEKYDKALQHIRAGDFPAQPDERRCARCPYLFVCPL